MLQTHGCHRNWDHLFTLSMFEGKSIRLRAYSKADLKLATAYLNDLETRSLMWPGIMFPLREEDEESWYNSFHAMSNGDYNFAIETISDTIYIGGCGIKGTDLKNRFAEIGIFLGKDFINKGYGTEAMGLLVDFCFGELNLNKVKLQVYEFNKRARRSYEKLGFKQEGMLREEIYRKGSYHDVLVMGLLKTEWSGIEK